MPDAYPVPLGPYLISSVEHADGVATLTLSGEFDLTGAQPVGDLLTGLEAAGPRAIVIDLRDLSFMDSTGVRVLIEAHGRSNGERPLAILNGSGPAHRTLTATGVDQILNMVSSLDELDEELSRQGAGSTT